MVERRSRRYRIFLAGGLFLLGLAGLFPSARAESAGNGATIWAEAQISEKRPFVQQSVIYMIMVVSRNTLSIVDPVPPSMSGVSLERLDEQPLSYTVNFKGKRYQVTAFRYAFTPLTLGKIDIPPAQFKITLASQWGGSPYTPGQAKGQQMELSTNKLSIDSQPPAAAQQPWLPLYALRLSGKLDKGALPKVGEPLTLTLTLSATGAGGAQLPSLASQLEKVPDFKVYPERPQTTQEVIADENLLFLSGKRVETYTLIPQRAGQLTLPELHVNWWNIREQKEDGVLWPAQPLAVVEGGGTSAADEKPAGQAAEPLQLGEGLPLFWQMLVNILLFVLGWWMGAGHPGTRQAKRAALALWAFLAPLREAAAQGLAGLRARFRPAAKPAKREAREFRARLAAVSPRQWAGQAGQKLVPMRFKAVFLLRRVDAAETPETLCHAIREFAHVRLGLPPMSALQDIARACCRAYPRLNKAGATALFVELERALYGQDKEFDILAWKDRFDEVFGSLPLRAPQPAKPAVDRGLPALNPAVDAAA